MLALTAPTLSPVPWRTVEGGGRALAGAAGPASPSAQLVGAGFGGSPGEGWQGKVESIEQPSAPVPRVLPSGHRPPPGPDLPLPGAPSPFRRPRAGTERAQGDPSGGNSLFSKTKFCVAPQLERSGSSSAAGSTDAPAGAAPPARSGCVFSSSFAQPGFICHRQDKRRRRRWQGWEAARGGSCNLCCPSEWGARLRPLPRGAVARPWAAAVPGLWLGVLRDGAC